MQGGGSLTLTGHLGDVMKESARTALSWFRAHAPNYGVDPAFYKDAEIHLHVPSGAIPKDGPSAGVTMVTALASELTGRPVRGDIAMTGEITLSGRVLPVGGVKEKVLAARRHGIREIILPRQNDKNVNEDLGEELRQDLRLHLVSTIEEVLALALQPAADQTTTPESASRGRQDRRGGTKPHRSRTKAAGFVRPVWVVQSRAYELDIGPHVWPISKYRLIREALSASATSISSSSNPPAASWDDLLAGSHAGVPRQDAHGNPDARRGRTARAPVVRRNRRTASG